jgi:CelD/BcsL family acetyltransferase involved in cellulose biosynthesis
MAEPTCRVESVETLDGVDRLESEWAELERRTPEATGFQSFRWCRAWLGADPEAHPRILCVREGERLVMLWPLQIQKRFGVSIARWIGEPLTQYGDALAEAGEGRARWREVGEAEMARWRDVDLFAFTRIRADGVLAEGACDGEPLSAPYVDLREARPRRHKSIERRARRLEANGPVTLVEARTSAERESLARHALALKREWLRSKGMFSAGLSHPASEDFLAALARDGFLRIHVLRVDGDVAAVDLGFDGGGAYRSFLGCFDNRFAEGSPGQALTSRLIAACAEQGLSAYDLLIPADAYKLLWASGETPVRARFKARNLRGRLAGVAFSSLRPLAKRAVQTVGRLAAGRFAFSSNAASLSPSRQEGRAS